MDYVQLTMWGMCLAIVVINPGWFGRKNAIYILILANTVVHSACQGAGWDGAAMRKLTEGRERRGRAWESQKTSQKNVRGARGPTLPIERMASMFMQIYASSEECALL